jgi:putative inorganic carbon (HCO3(-)) transporter
VVHPSAEKGIGLLLVAAWLVRRCRGRLHSARRSAVLESTIAFAVAILVATVVHNNGSAGLEVVLRYAGFLVVLLVVADVLRAGLEVDRVARVYVLACAAAAVCGLLTFGAGLDRRVGGPIGDPNDFAFFLLPAVAMGLAVRTTVVRRWPWDLATLLIVVAVLGTLSRGALLGLVAMAVLALAARMVRLRTAFGMGVVVGAVLLVVAVAVPGMVSTSIEQKGVVADQNVSERLELWSAAARMTLEHPVLGMGPGAFSLHHDEYTGLPDDIGHNLDVAHNTWLEITSELGLVGLAAFLAILVTAWATAWSAWRRRADPHAAAVVVALVGAAVAATFVTEQYYLPLWLLFALAAGVGEDRT